MSFTFGPLTVDTDNHTASFNTAAGSVVVDANNGTVTTTDANGNTLVVGGFGSNPTLQSAFTSKYLKGSVYYFPAPGGLLNGVVGAQVSIHPLGVSGQPVTFTTDDRGVYEGPPPSAWVLPILVADVTFGSHTINNVPLPYNTFSAEMFPIIVPLDWTEPPVPVGTFFRRNNLKRLSTDEKKTLGDFILKQFLDDDIVGRHMQQVDHITCLFSDHRTFVWQLEKALLQAGLRQFVPLPVWEPIDDIPAPFDKVHITQAMRDANNAIYLHINPIYNQISPSLRPLIPDPMKPANIAATGFPTAHSLALYMGRSAASAIGSFHFNAHFLSGGPFFDMMFAAGAVLFWPVHALLVEIYDSWLATKFTGTNLQSAVAVRIVDGQPYLSVFTVTDRNELWHCYEREVVKERNDLSLLEARTAVVPLFDPEHVLMMHEPHWPHWSHWEQLEAHCAVVDLRTVMSSDGDWIVLARDDQARFCLMRQNPCGGVDCFDVESTAVHAFACELADDGTLQIAFVGPRSNILYLGAEKFPRSHTFTWKGKAVQVQHGFMPTVEQIQSIKGRDRKIHLFVSTLSPDSPPRRHRVGDPGATGNRRLPPGPNISMAKPGTMFHLRLDTDWVLDEQPFSYLPLRKYCLANCHEDCIQVFGIHDEDRKLYTADLPIVIPSPARPARVPVRPAHEHGTGGHSHPAPGRENGPTRRLLPDQPIEWTMIETQDRELVDLAACNHADGRIELFALDAGGRVWHASEDTHWGTWSEIPLLTVMGGDTLDIFAANDYTGCIKVFVHCKKENFIYVAEQLEANSSDFVGWMNV